MSQTDQNGRTTGHNSESARERAALDALGEKVKAAQIARTPKTEADQTGWAVGMRYASEFTAAIMVGGLLGAGIDHFANTAPWALLAGLGLGFTAGIRNIVRAAQEMNKVDE